MINLLYFEEYETKLSHRLFERNDINPIIIRTNKNLKYFSDEYLDYTDKFYNYVIDYYNDIKIEIIKFKTWLKEKNLKIDYFLNDSEYYLEFSNKFARELGLYALDDKQISWVRDKVCMKDKFRNIGIDTVDYQAINSKDELIQFFIKHGYKQIIFKPRKGMNSIDTYIIHSISDIDNLELNITQGKYMAETFCYDQEWSIESLVQNGIVLDSYITYIPNPTIWASISNDLNCHMTVPTTPSYFNFVPRDFIQKIVSGMNLKDGTMTIEVFIDNNGNVKASELGWRLPGCQATTNHSLSYGIDIYNLLLDIAVHKEVKLDYSYPLISVGDLYLPNKEGVVSYVTPLEELLQMEGVIDGELFVEIGKYQKKRRVGNDSSGWIQVIGTDEMETLKRMQAVYDHYSIDVAYEKGAMQYVKK